MSVPPVASSGAGAGQVRTLIDSARSTRAVPNPWRRSAMSRATTTMLLWLLAAALVGGCSRSKEDLVEKSRSASTRAELERALGKPSDIAKLGPVEQWTYKASNGSVVFLIVGDKVTLQAAGPDDKKETK